MIRFSFLFAALLFTGFSAISQTMDFSSGASHPGFTLPGSEWNSGAGAIWIANLANPSTISKDQGKFDFISFEVGPTAGVNMIRLTSDNGDTLIYDESIKMTHTLNWDTISSLKFERASGAGATADIDNLVYCERPNENITPGPNLSTCVGDTVTVYFSGGELGGAASWNWYENSCNFGSIGNDTSLEVTPTSAILYMVRAEGGCLLTPGNCLTVSSVLAYNPPAAPTITASPDSLFCSSTGSNYNWYLNGVLQNAHHDQGIPISGNGNYEVEVYVNVCWSDKSNAYEINTTDISKDRERKLMIYPNPAQHELFVSFSATQQSEIEVSFIDMQGRIALINKIEASSGTTKISIERLDRGLYTLAIKQLDRILFHRILIE